MAASIYLISTAKCLFVRAPGPTGPCPETQQTIVQQLDRAFLITNFIQVVSLDTKILRFVAMAATSFQVGVEILAIIICPGSPPEPFAFLHNHSSERDRKDTL